MISSMVWTKTERGNDKTKTMKFEWRLYNKIYGPLTDVQRRSALPLPATAAASPRRTSTSSYPTLKQLCTETVGKSVGTAAGGHSKRKPRPVLEMRPSPASLAFKKRKVDGKPASALKGLTDEAYHLEKLKKVQELLDAAKASCYGHERSISESKIKMEQIELQV